ncbi:MAG: tryptophan 7-halogenase [Hyphomonadaceae bacterium]|nr:tryptophan 7-halogenase [Hyphomonadaceae bacterium]
MKRDIGQVVKRVVIAGGGTAGWVTAAVLAEQLGQLIEITLVESEEIGTVGVGEATFPTVRNFHILCNLDERAFMSASQGSFKLGISFENWARKGDRYIHSFGTIGRSTWMGDFHHFWLQARAEGYEGGLSDLCLEYKAAEQGKFAISDKVNINYAYHFDAGLYARYLRQVSEPKGVKRIEGKIVDVAQNGETGFIEALTLDNGQRIEGDLFIDCTGFRGLLIEQKLKAGWEDWGKWLRNDSALAVQTPSTDEIPPFTRAIAHEAGWQWKIPLQHRVGNGLVYASDYISEEDARKTLIANLDREPLFEPRLIRFRAGRRLKAWDKNVIAMGLASGFIEPLESTSIHLFQIAATRLVQLFPFSGCTPSIMARNNALAQQELEKVRDFIIMHYKLTERDDTPYWRDCGAMEIPDSIAQRIALFRENGLVYQEGDEMFRVDSWLQVMLGQRLEPQGRHHMGRMLPQDRLRAALDSLKGSVAAAVEKMPTHKQFLAQYCPGAA